MRLASGIRIYLAYIIINILYYMLKMEWVSI